MFYMPSCPYCRQAEGFLKSLMENEPRYRAIEIERIDETAKPEIAEQYDYWHVPTFYVGNEKLHEGVPTLEKVEAVLKAAIE